MLSRFLDMLGVDSRDDLVSEIDSNHKEGSMSNSSQSSDPRSPRPPRKDPWEPLIGHPFDSDDSEDNIPPPDPLQPEPEHGNQMEEDLQPEQGHLPEIPEVPAPVHPENLGAVRRRAFSQGKKVPRKLTPIDRLVNDLNLSKIDKEKLKRHYKSQADLTAMSEIASTHHRLIKELERKVQHPNPRLRRRAEFELQEAMDMIKIDLHEAIKFERAEPC
jgi:hypothetical protein